jgi:chromate transporter
MPSNTPLREVIALFLRLGFTAFGGPAAHIAMFRDEVVTRRGWMTDQEFLDLLGATNLIPGPNSTEMAIHIGYARAGWRGLIAAGLCFILPAALIVLALAMLYVQYGSTPAAEWLLYGIKPVIIAVILQAIWGLMGKAAKTIPLALIGFAVLVLYMLGAPEIPLMFGAALLVMLLRNLLPSIGSLVIMLPPLFVQAAAPVSMGTLFLTFLKIGSVLYGSGYVLLAFLRTDFVEGLGWLTTQQLLDAVAIGQFTPGPLFTTATFIGYLMGGIPGAILGTLGIFLPSFIFVFITHPYVARMRQSPWLGALLDGVNVAALALMAGVTLELAQSALIDGVTIMLAIVTAVLLIRFKINSTWLILGGAIVGLAVHFISLT